MFVRQSVAHMRRASPLLASVLAALAVCAAASAAGPGPLAGTWGGTVTASTGEAVTVDISSQVPEDPALQLRWADYLTTLAHGPEISTVTVVLSSLRQVQSTCGRRALACYINASATIYAPLDDVPGEATAQSILAHEYGHHVAAGERNDPWRALDWGTKRWATAMGICAGVKANRLVPGDQGISYLYNPGEAFAESYRVLNERRLGLPQGPWDIVDTSLQPSQAALDALLLDIQSPWAGPRLVTRKSSFVRASKTSVRTFTLATPLDGSLSLAVKAPKGTVFRPHAASNTICGQRSVTVTVTRVKGYGAFTHDATLP
jgi:hypothetical protein